jgi:hypothetical protein
MIEGSPPRAEIQVNGRELASVVADAWNVVHQANQPAFIYLDERRLVRRIHLESGKDLILPVGRTALRGILIHVADWVRVTPSGPVPARVPPAVVDQMLRCPDPALPDAHR